jgi:hypothetical protein
MTPAGKQRFTVAGHGFLPWLLLDLSGSFPWGGDPDKRVNTV